MHTYIMILGTDFRWIGDFLLTDKACAHIRIESTLHYNSLGFLDFQISLQKWKQQVDIGVFKTPMFTHYVITEAKFRLYEKWCRQCSHFFYTNETLSILLLCNFCGKNWKTETKSNQKFKWKRSANILGKQSDLDFSWIFLVSLSNSSWIFQKFKQQL